MLGLNVSAIIDIAREWIVPACRIDGRGKTGGYLCVASPYGNHLMCIIGQIPNPEKEAQYRKFCQEKALRLLRLSSHISSWESRDEVGKMYGGAVLADSNIVFSFSGLTEHMDEAFAAIVACHSRRGITPAQWNEIRRISKNPHMLSYGYLNNAA
jgi:hypothetical protein